MDISIRQRFLNLAVSHDAPLRHVRLLLDGRVWRAFDVSLATGEPDFWAPLDVSLVAGQTLTVEVDGEKVPQALAAAFLAADTEVGGEGLYLEALRPAFHFTSRRGWTNDPNGLVYYDGEYHLFYQHNPFGCRWGNMHWGHAISQDLLHWRELDDALAPNELGTIYSGSAVVDGDDTAGFRTGLEAPLVCAYTAAGGRSPESVGAAFTQCLAYSNDRGRSWARCEANPVLGHVVGENRDPKVIWHAPTRRWVMALFLEGNRYGLFASPNLRDWCLLCELELPGASECPDFFPLPTAGGECWVLWGANGTYCLGEFDGEHFRPTTEPARLAWGDAYAAQTWSDAPVCGARLQIAWLRGDIPGMPFNQMMGFPLELSLEGGPGGTGLRARPVRQIRSLHLPSHVWRALSSAELGHMLAGVHGELLHLRAELEVGASGHFGMHANGMAISYDAARAQLVTPNAVVPVTASAGRLALELLIDRTSVEAFVADGRAYVAVSAIKPKGALTVAVDPGAQARVIRAEVHELGSIWE